MGRRGRGWVSSANRLKMHQWERTLNISAGCEGLPPSLLSHLVPAPGITVASSRGKSQRQEVVGSTGTGLLVCL